MNMESESPCWDASPSPSLAYSHVPKSMDADTAYARPVHTPVLSPAELATPWPRSPSQEAPVSMDRSGTEMYHVDLSQWYPQYQACLQFLVEQGQHTPAVQSLAAFLNMRLPGQRASTAAPTGSLLRTYIRRLIVTAHDTPAVLQAFFGPEWRGGLATIWQQERINYLFTAKSGGWASTKAAYDGQPDEQTPFLRPLREPTEEELRMAESQWSEWLAMEDWMVGPRRPVGLSYGRLLSNMTALSSDRFLSEPSPPSSEARALTIDSPTRHYTLLVRHLSSIQSVGAPPRHHSPGGLQVPVAGSAGVLPSAP
ncbi:hypothetical protein BDV59DRAFT_197889 [Aspergillus ambiguus]|uniref:uncharacterized protein n=1 Tax=Aspergillus ambiguus TaxID=176160 RepID=UPI003CCDE611